MIDANAHEKARDLTARSLGLNRFMAKSYLYTGVNLATSIGVAYGLSRMANFEDKGIYCFAAGIGASLVGVIASKLIKPKKEEKRQTNGEVVYSTKNSIFRLTFYSLASVGLGAVIAPLLAQTSDPVIIGALSMTGAAFAGTSLIAYNMDREQSYSWKSTLLGCSIGLGALSLVGGIVWLVRGSNALTDGLVKLQNWLGILMFGVYMIVDTHTAIERYENKDADHLDVSLEFTLNALNIFVRLIQLMNGDSGNRRRRRDE